MSAQIQRSAMDALWECRRAWARTQDQLDIFSVLNAAPDPPVTLAGRCVEHAEPKSHVGAPAHTTLTAASAARAGLVAGIVTGASACSLTNQGEA